MDFWKEFADLIKQLQVVAEDQPDLPFVGGAQHRAFEGGFLCGMDYADLLLGAEEALNIYFSEGFTVGEFLQEINKIQQPVAA